MEIRHPPVQYEARLIVKVDRQGQDHALRDEEGNESRERDPGEIVERLGQLGAALRGPCASLDNTFAHVGHNDTLRHTGSPAYTHAITEASRSASMGQ